MSPYSFSICNQRKTKITTKKHVAAVQNLLFLPKNLLNVQEQLGRDIKPDKNDDIQAVLEEVSANHSCMMQMA